MGRPAWANPAQRGFSLDQAGFIFRWAARPELVSVNSRGGASGGGGGGGGYSLLLLETQRRLSPILEKILDELSPYSEKILNHLSPVLKKVFD
jgi:hypothetical protein